MVNISGKMAVGIAVVCVLLTAAYGTAVWMAVTEWVPPWVDVDIDDDDEIPADTQFSSFKVNGVREDATSTSITSATTRVWYDENFDDVMQYSELGSFTEASGVYTTNNENYPIGEDFEFWVQMYASAHFVTYAQVHMTGDRNTDGSAKMAGEIEVRQVDDALTWSGQANSAAFDTTDYNATATDTGSGSGDSGTLEAEMILSAADKGLATQVWDAIGEAGYEKAYGIDKEYPYFIKWDTINEGTDDTIRVADASILAGTFFAAICTTTDMAELVIDIADFEYYHDYGSNTFMHMFMNTADGQDWMYNSDDTIAPRPQFSFSFGPATAAGNFLSTNGIGVWMDVQYNQMIAGTWDRTAAGYVLGTPGDHWAWTHT